MWVPQRTAQRADDANLPRQVLEEKPANALDVLETSLLVKKTTFDYKESSPLVPVSVSGPALFPCAHARAWRKFKKR